jgi:hypothetical protein
MEAQVKAIKLMQVWSTPRLIKWKTEPSQRRHVIRTLRKKEIHAVDISFRETFS